MVEVGRQPEVFGRPLEPDEAQRLVKVPRTTRDRILLRHFPWLDDHADIGGLPRLTASSSSVAATVAIFAM